MADEKRPSPRNVISVRFSDEELVRVKETSDRRGIPLSTLIREAALDGRALTVGAAVRTGSGNDSPAGGLQATVTTTGVTADLYAPAAGGTATYRAFS